MMMRRMPRLVAVAVFASMFAPRIADACSASACGVSSFTPAEGTTVPENLPAIDWHPASSPDAAEPSKVTLVAANNPTVPIPLTATPLSGGDYALVLGEPLVAGTAYVITDANLCYQSTGPTVTFRAGPAASLPVALGSLTMTDGGVGPLEVATISGSCSSDVAAAQDSIELALAQDAAPWQDALMFETFVDGTPWSPRRALNIANVPGTSWQGRGVDLVFSVCETDDPGGALDGVEVGTHTVEMRARVPGTTTVLTSTAVTIDLQCAGAAGSSDSSGCSANRGARAPWLLLALLPILRRRGRRTA
jgi:hypothetical protein